MRHSKFDEVKTLIASGIPVILQGPAGTGKTTVVRQVAEELKLEFCVLSMTRQTTLSHIIGFMNVNGIYIPSMFRKAVEYGHLFLLDEIDAADPNVILALNTLENGFVSFPDAVIEVHENFRLVATSNPFGDCAYTGRATLDAATLDRFDKVHLARDSRLEASMVSEETLEEIERVRQILHTNNVGTTVSMRDSLRWDKRKALGITENYIHSNFFKEVPHLYHTYLADAPKPKVRQEDIISVEELWDSVNHEEVETSITTAPWDV